ncbi:MAG: histidine kinase [bacterium]|nr:histidine kinase [bacterium]
MRTGLLKYFLVISLAVIIVTAFLLFGGQDWSQADTITLGWFLISSLLIWLGNRFITKWMDRKFPWNEYGNWRFFAQIAMVLFYSLSIVNLAYYLFKVFLTDTPPAWEQFLVMNAYGTLIIIPVTSIYFGIYFLRSWNRSRIEAQVAQKETIQAQLQTLRNHLDPHFLFNNLNILSALIDTDREQSQKFLEKFAEVYRVILKTEKDELIPLSQELEFIESYIYLIDIRFRDLIDIKIDIIEDQLDQLIPPLTIQMLIENAFKHNIITEDDILKIEITSEENRVAVINTLNKAEENGNSNNTGLKNITLRYGYYTEDKIDVSETETHFKVTVPLIQIASYESSDI